MERCSSPTYGCSHARCAQLNSSFYGGGYGLSWPFMHGQVGTCCSSYSAADEGPASAATAGICPFAPAVAAAPAAAVGFAGRRTECCWDACLAMTCALGLDSTASPPCTHKCSIQHCQGQRDEERCIARVGGIMTQSPVTAMTHDRFCG